MWWIHFTSSATQKDVLTTKSNHEGGDGHPHDKSSKEYSVFATTYITQKNTLS